MITACPKCKTKFKIPEEKIKPGGSRFKCTKCGEVMLVKLSRAQLRERAGKPAKPPERPKAKDIPAEGSAPEHDETQEEMPPQPPPEVPPMYRGFLKEEKQEDDRPFTERLPEAFGYPFRGNGIWMLAAGTPFFWIMIGVSRYSILGFLVIAGILGFLVAFMMKIISYSADGDNDVPNWPEISDFWDAIVGPIGQMLAILLVSFAPSLIYYFFFKSTGVIFLFLCALGLLYAPMALIIVSMMGSLLNIINPVMVISSIFKMPVDYLLACAVLFVLVGIEYATTRVTSYMPIAGSLIDTFLMLYFLMLEMRILGLLYYTNRKQFGWYDIE